MFSNNNIVMLASIISLLLVILFVLLLHIYAKLFLAQSHPRRRRTPVTLSDFPIPSNFHHHLNIQTPLPFKGLDSTIVLTIPTFVSEEKTEELECVICLSYIEKGEIGRKLPKCGHVFHVECIDMWFVSHCNCPICRNLIVHDDDDGDDDSHGGDVNVEIVIDTPSYESGSVSVMETSSLSLFGFSLKRILSKVFISSHHVNELDDASQ